MLTEQRTKVNRCQEASLGSSATATLKRLRIRVVNERATCRFSLRLWESGICMSRRLIATCMLTSERTGVDRRGVNRSRA